MKRYIITAALLLTAGLCSLSPGRSDRQSGVLKAEAAEAQESRSTYRDEVGSYGMLPIYPLDIEPGVYEVEAETNSRFFTLHDMVLTVSESADADHSNAQKYMSLTFYIDSTSYTELYLGTAEETAEADENKLIEADVQNGVTYFTVPLEALDQAVDLAAFSKAKQRWYDRQVLCLASSLPEQALSVELPDYERIEAALAAYEQQSADGEDGSDSGSGSDTAETEKHTRVLVMGQRDETESDAAAENTSGSAYENVTENSAGSTDAAADEGQETETVRGEGIAVDLQDGEYSIEAVMTGGSGRASISSPTYMMVEEGRAYATLLWSSTHYDYMIVEGITYLNEAEDGGISRFTIPITHFDAPIDVIADTTAMGDPVEIAYAITFYEDSIGDRGLVPQEAAKRVLITALIMILAGGLLNMIVKRKRR